MLRLDDLIYSNFASFGKIMACIVAADAVAVTAIPLPPFHHPHICHPTCRNLSTK